jgi:large subunit ribosomal protein L10
MSKNERQSEVESLSEQLKGSPTLYVSDFTGLTVERMTDLRRRLRAVGGRYVVVKNTLAGRALAANAVEGLDDHLAGPTGLVLAGDDPLPAAKALLEFSRTADNRPAVRVGLVDGKLVEPAYVKRLGELPSREELLAQFAGALNGILYQVVGALEALREQRQAAS